MKKKFQEFTYCTVKNMKLVPIHTVAFPVDEKETVSEYKLGFLVTVHDKKGFGLKFGLGEKSKWINPWNCPFDLKLGGWVKGDLIEREVFTTTVEFLR